MRVHNHPDRWQLYRILGICPEDLEAKTPGMICQGEKLEVIGRGEPIYHINSRRVQDTDELKRLNFEQIKNIEVINNPGSEYDATVNAVVRIKTIRQQGEGLGMDMKSQMRQTLSQGRQILARASS